MEDVTTAVRTTHNTTLKKARFLRWCSAQQLSLWARRLLQVVVRFGGYSSRIDICELSYRCGAYLQVSVLLQKKMYNRVVCSIRE